MGLDPETMNLAGDTVEQQAEQALKNLMNVIKEAGGSCKQVVKTTVLLASMDDFPKVNEIYAKCTGGCRSRCLELRFLEVFQDGASSSEPPLLVLPTPTLAVAEEGDKNSLSDRLCRLVGFDSTGLACLWPSELLLAHIFLSPTAMYARLWDAIATTASRRTWRRVCELGAGMTAAAGLATVRRKSIVSESDDPLAALELVALSDGNEDCIAAIQQAVQLQEFSRNRTDSPALEVEKLRWPSSDASPMPDGYIPAGWQHSFDLLFGADCLFHHETHHGLLNTVDRLLSCTPGSLCLFVAPQRSGSLLAFNDLVAQNSTDLHLSCIRLEPLEAFPTLGPVMQYLITDTDRLVPHLLLIRRT
ncbi:unnamed protein product [Schistocephalus solidus]|uniref:Calmodulin-lysine N-methyltransferase n=1 Tax=Schistocephalus solidus TaxID=70667 RepID=A0A3P7C3A7_SCHSO|nr:unnamed protein product [Schistocephalus solidus]